MDKTFSIKPGNALAPFLNKRVGFVKINEVIKHHNNQYECAAWWEDSEVQPGIYPLILEKNYLHPHHIQLKAKLSAIVTDDFFPSFYGGVGISGMPYKPQRIGQKREITYTFDVVNAIDHTGHIPSSTKDFFVDFNLINPIISDARDNLLIENDCLVREMENYINNGDGKYQSNLSMIVHYSGNIKNLTEAIMLLSHKIKDFENMTPYTRNNFESNTSWVNQATESAA